MYRQSKAYTYIRCLRYRFKQEVASIEFVRKLDMRGSTMFDVGANRGVYSIYMSRAAGPAGRLISFEPQPELGPHLESVKRQFKLTNMQVVNKGLSDKPGVLVLRRTEVGSGAATFEKFGSGRTASDLFDVPVTTIDAFVDENLDTQVSFIKCDVEGHELNVFKGARRVLSSHQPLLLFEAHDSELADGELEAFMSDLGYEGFFFFVDPSDHASFWRRGRGHYVQFAERHDYAHCRPGVEHRNYVFVRAGSSPDDYLRK